VRHSSTVNKEAAEVNTRVCWLPRLIHIQEGVRLNLTCRKLPRNVLMISSAHTLTAH